MFLVVTCGFGRGPLGGARRRWRFLRIGVVFMLAEKYFFKVLRDPYDKSAFCYTQSTQEYIKTSDTSHDYVMTLGVWWAFGVWDGYYAAWISRDEPCWMLPSNWELA